MSARGDYQGAVDARRRMVAEAAGAAVTMQAKPTLKRYSWSRFHSDLLDDNRWALVALRAEAPLSMVEALVVRLEIHANKSSPRGYVGDFSAEAMAARWGADAAIVARVCAELERSDIGWIDQDQVVTFWARNPDKVDETAAARQQRVRDRKKGFKRLAELYRQGAITEAERHEREVALKNSKEPAELIAAWAPNSSRRDSVTVTPRADLIINQDGEKRSEKSSAAAPPAMLGTNLVPVDAAVFADPARALQWIQGDGEALVTGRFGGLRSKACEALKRWSVTLGGDATVLAKILHAALGTTARNEAFRTLVTNQVARQATEMLAPALPLPPVPIKGGSG